MKKKLLISIGTMSHGGAERVISILSKRFVEEFQEIEILMWYDYPIHYDLDKRINLIFLPRLSGTSSRLKNTFHFRKYVNKSNPDIVLSFLTPFNMLVLCAMVGLKNKVIVCERNDPHFISGGKLMEIIRNNLYRLANGALVQTNYGWSCFPQYIKKKMSVIYNPIIMPDDMIGKAIQTPKEKLFVSVGRLESQKNHRMMLNAFHVFYQKHKDYRLLVYGEGTKRSEIEEYIRVLKLQDAVSLPGSCKDIWNRLLSAKAFLLSSDAEGMSNALIEAMCLGLPPISTKVSGSTDLILNGKNGFLVDLNDYKDFAEKMEYFAEKDTLSIELGRLSCTLYDKLNYEAISQQWIDYLKKF